MDPDKRQRLRQNHIFLKENLRIQPVLDRLYQRGVLSDDDTDFIRSKSITSDQIQEFLDCLRRSGNNGYVAFCESLREVQPDILKVLDETKIDRETLGEVSHEHIFFDPSEDFELKGLIDQLTTDNKVSPEQLERLKYFVMDENGCPEEIIEKKDTPQKFFRHLMKTRLLTRYNLAFLQGLLWRVGNKEVCREVANFARQNNQRPIHFYTPRGKAENGYSFGKFHIKGNLDNFKGVTIEEICLRVARYLGVPLSYVIPAGVEPSESIVVTIMLHNEALVLLETVENFLWLADLGVDYIIHGGTRILIDDQPEINEDFTTELKLLEQELKRTLKSEQHLKQCLYDEQMSNEILKDQQREQEEQLKHSEDTIKELKIWYTRVFAVLLLALHFIAEFVKLRRGLLDQGWTLRVAKSVHSRYEAALKKAKEWSSNHASLLELIEATKLLRMTMEQEDINRMKSIAYISLLSMEQNFAEAVTTRMTERLLGVAPLKQRSLEEIRQERISFELIIGITRVEPMLQEILRNIASRLDDEERQRVCKAFKVPNKLQTSGLRHLTFDYIIFAELDKMGKIISTNDDIDPIMKAALKEIGRKDLWEEFQVRNKQRQEIQKQQMENQTRKQTDINERLDKIEKMMQTMVSQNVMGSMGMQGHGYNGGTHSEMAGFPDQFLAFLKNPGIHLSTQQIA